MIDMKKLIVILIMAVLGIAAASNYVPGAISDIENAMEYNSASYKNNKVYVTYRDGTSAVISYGSKEELKQGLEMLKKAEDVLKVQPNNQ